jgi:hypothetical protein
VDLIILLPLKLLSGVNATFATLAFLHKNSRKQRNNSENLAVLWLPKPSAAQDFRRESDVDG